MSDHRSMDSLARLAMDAQAPRGALRPDTLDRPILSPADVRGIAAALALTDSGVSPHWPTAGIVDARAFRVGVSATVHEPTHARSNLIRGQCGIVARVVETDGPRATWADAYVDCPTCLARR